jgi:hypothetical protein
MKPRNDDPLAHVKGQMIPEGKYSISSRVIKKKRPMQPSIERVFEHFPNDRVNIESDKSRLTGPVEEEPAKPKARATARKKIRDYDFGPPIQK